ncbi:MAG TPA: hypothetical protein VEW25_09260 [Allosphingosinicella sp.]|nr:hypothetical protein [Allosphingosinicella sp.]
MRSKLLSSLVAGSLVFSSSVAIAQPSDSSLDPVSENGDDDSETATAIIFGLIVFMIAIWVGRDGGEDEDIGLPTSP